mmetsp:Transcript_15484/g.39969  ORF Transcript_15484/g.39969 Transcript_15484/m.39969 type:complete len:300 (+) Transcript_15484:361-1260(+)
MVVIGRFFVAAISCMPACAACLRPSASATRSSSSASVAPSRIASRSETSDEPKRQTLRLPSAVSRRRLQPAQKGCVIEAMNDKEPAAPGSRYETATSCGGVGSLARPGCASRSRPSIASSGTIVSDDHLLPSKGMYSMKRTSIGFSRDSCANASSSSSFVPAIRTTLSLRGAIPSSRARSIASSTRASPSRRVSCTKRWRSSVSSERLSRSSPLLTSFGNLRGRAMPLLVIAIWRRPIGRSSLSALTISGRSGRTVGSPPVSRILSTPARTKSLAIRSVSSVVSKRDDGVRFTPSSGMQ